MRNCSRLEEIDESALESILHYIPEANKMNGKKADLLMDPPTEDAIKLLVHMAPKGKSLGLDGLPFELYKVLFNRHPQSLSLFNVIMQDAMTGVFPPSWKKTRMTLLFKKGDPELLANWRPLSLINTDAKLFTKLLANRLSNTLPKMLTQYQTGFVKGRLISDNGWTFCSAMEHMKEHNEETPVIGVMIDQEKAYDRVHPTYLAEVMRKLGFPNLFINTISKLFFETQVSTSINGWLGKPFQQRRGLRQGDPLSPLLFNLAIEPFIQNCLQDENLPGIPWPLEMKANRRLHDYRDDAIIEPPSLKIMAYADDVVAFVENKGQWSRLMENVERYRAASNAKINLQKTVMISLSGERHEQWAKYAERNLITWHDKFCTDPVNYLGYPLHSSPLQFHNFLEQIHAKLQRHIQMHGSRSLGKFPPTLSPLARSPSDCSPKKVAKEMREPHTPICLPIQSGAIVEQHY
jgi:hypothetical protein